MDWGAFWHFLFRFITGLGLVVFFLALLGITLGGLAGLFVYVSNQSFAGMVGACIIVPLIGAAWWVSFHVCLDFLEQVGITLKGGWSWLVLPVALVLAPLLFFGGTLAGIGELATAKPAVALSFGLGLGLLIALAAILIR